jgi:two-component system response regulator RegX3
MNGIEVLKEVNERYPDLSVIILTASASYDSAIAALRLGAVDYIEKPVAAREVLAAIRDALAKRSDTRRRLVELLGLGEQLIGPGGAGQPAKPIDGSVQRFETESGTIVFEPEKLQVTLDGRSVSLTPGETAVLGILLEYLDHPVSPRDIAVGAWGETLEEVSAENIIRPHIYRLRQKLETEPSSPRTILTVRGKGYVIHSA